MAQDRETVVERVRRQTVEGQLADDVRVVYRVQGGVHGQSVDETVALTAAGKVCVDARDDIARKPHARATEDVGREVVLEICRLIDGGFEELIPREAARFVPDSMVGSVSIGVGDEEETYFFDADEDDAERNGRPRGQGLKRLIGRFEELERACLGRAPRGNGASRPRKGGA